MTQASFVPGDILVLGGETYQVLEDHGEKGMVIPFPAPEGVEHEQRVWAEEAGCRRIGNAPLPAPSPCATGDGCPTEGRLAPAAAAPPDPNLIAKA